LIKVLFLTSVYSDLTGGTKYNKNFVERFIKDDFFEVDILTDADFGATSGMRWFSAIKLYKDVVNIVSKYDIVIIDSSKCKQLAFYVGKMVKKNKNTQFITILHHYDFHTRTGLSKLLCKFLELRFVNKMNKIIYASDYTYSLKDKYIKKHIDNILLRVPVKIYDTKKISWETNLLSTIGGVGYGKRKGHHLMVEALNKVKEDIEGFNLKIMGKFNENDGTIKQVIKQLEDCGLREKIIYTGRVSEGEKYNILENSKFYVFPSQYEGYGLSMLEAMAAGLPVVAFNNSAMSTVIRNGETGFLCESVEEFAEKIKLLYNDTRLCERMGRNAIEYVKTCQTKEKFE